MALIGEAAHSCRVLFTMAVERHAATAAPCVGGVPGSSGWLVSNVAVTALDDSQLRMVLHPASGRLRGLRGNGCIGMTYLRAKGGAGRHSLALP
jgi:hypothetical protein